MRNSQVPRVELTREARLLLDAEALLTGKDLKSIVSDLIVENASSRAREIAILVAGEPQPPYSHSAESPTPDPTGSNSSGPATLGRKLKTPIRDDPEAQALIRRRWAEDPRPTYKSIAQDLGRAESSVYVWISQNLATPVTDEEEENGGPDL